MTPHVDFVGAELVDRLAVPIGSPASMGGLQEQAHPRRWAQMAGRRRFRVRPGLLRPGQSQVRLHTAIARHTVLVMAALAVCAVTAALLRDRTDTQAPPPVRPGQRPPPTRE
jgi:hypothetical protein